MTYTVKINIAGADTPLNNGRESALGHMWYETSGWAKKISLNSQITIESNKQFKDFCYE